MPQPKNTPSATALAALPGSDARPQGPASRRKKSAPPDQPPPRPKARPTRVRQSGPAPSPQPLPAEQRSAALDDAPLWTPNSPIPSRIAQLQKRNAVLQAQLHQLHPSFQVKGKKT